jgi:hypothetical protein
MWGGAFTTTSGEIRERPWLRVKAKRRSVKRVDAKAGTQWRILA